MKKFLLVVLSVVVAIVLLHVLAGIGFFSCRTARPSSSQCLVKMPDVTRFADFSNLKPNAPSTDNALRSWLDIRSIVTNYTLPEDAKFYYVVFLEFEDGKLNAPLNGYISAGALSINFEVSPDKPVGERTLGSLNEDNDLIHRERNDGRDLRIELLWSADTPKILFALSNGTANSETTRTENDFWMKLDGTISTGAGWGAYKGFTILGRANSRLNQKAETARSSTSELGIEIADKKYVGALAIKTFASVEELRKDLEALHKIWE